MQLDGAERTRARLADALRKMPHGVVLVDAVDTAPAEVIDALVRLAREGRLDDEDARPVAAESAVVIATSAAAHDGAGPLHALLAAARVATFDALAPADVRRVLDRLLQGVARRLTDKGLSLHLSRAAYDALAEAGFRFDTGAREMERVVEERLIAPLATGVLDGRFRRGATVYAHAKDGVLTLSTQAPARTRA